MRQRIPVYIASLGPKNVTMTAARAEGWLPHDYRPDRAADVWGAALQAGLARREAGLPPLEIVAGGPLAIGDDVEHLREATKPRLALYFGGMGARGPSASRDPLALPAT